nr:TetR/AcrR family transcriptional regulator [Clostridium sp. D33t1_170424_F3]
MIDTGLELFSRQGIQHTTVEQIYTRVGISRTFFYSFFPAKEDLVVQALYCQQPQLLAYAQRLMNDPELSWREGVRQFLHTICYGKQSGFTILSVEEQQALFKCLSGENRQSFLERRLTFFTELLHTFGIHTGEPGVKLLGNLVFSAAILRKAIPETLPFLFADAADEMAGFQIDAILNYMETLRRQ